MKNFHFSQSAQRFSLRKYAFGVASVLLSCTFLGVSAVAAEEVTNDGTISSEASVEKVELALSETNVSSTSVVDRIENSGTVTGEGVLAVSTEEVREEPISQGNEEPTIVEKEVGAMPTFEEVSEPLSNESEQVASEAGIAESLNRVTIEEPKYDGEVSPVPESRGVAFRMASRSARDTGVIGDDYPSEWKFRHNEYDTWGYNKSTCTSFVAHRLHRVNKFDPPRGLGHAGSWASNARAQGYRVDNSPVLGSVAYDLSDGHVAWVANVSGDFVTIEEYNYGRKYVYNTRTVAKSAFTGFIHFKDLSSPQVGNPSESGGNVSLPSSGVYHFSERLGIKNEPKISSPDIAFYEKGESVHYDKVVTADNHRWISYISYSGNRRYIATKKLVSTPQVKGAIHVENKNDQAGTFDVLIRNVSSNDGLNMVQVPIWSDKDGQDDIVWYQAFRQENGDYKTSVNINNHKGNRGTYHIHLYYVTGSGKQVGVGGTTVTVAEEPASTLSSAKPRGTISIENKNDRSGTFDVVVRDVYSPKGVKEVRLPIWSAKDDQDDIIWYTAKRQGDGSYKVSVSTESHKRNQGDYIIHMYYVQDDNQLVFAGSVTTVVQMSSQPSIPDSGSYTFTSRVGVRNEPNFSSPEITYYTAGGSVTYDTVVHADGRYWISYISLSGVRRYVNIT